MKLTPELILALFNAFGPLWRQIFTRLKTQTGLEPTDAEMAAELTANLDTYLREGATWTATHPRPEKPTV